MTDVELALAILQQNNQPMYFRDLISQVLETKTGRAYSLAQAMAEIHTQINLDSRFAYLGKGMWGLSGWTPQQGVRDTEQLPAAMAATNMRREKLLAEIQQDYVAATLERPEE